MSKPEHLMIVAREWIAKAENDLKNAANTLKMGEDCPTDTVCFHAQQCAEKYLKAFLLWKGVPFPKTHDLPSLILLLPKELHNLLTVEEQELLTEYATVTRYPGCYEDITLSEARSAVRVARKSEKTYAPCFQGKCYAVNGRSRNLSRNNKTITLSVFQRKWQTHLTLWECYPSGQRRHSNIERLSY